MPNFPTLYYDADLPATGLSADPLLLLPQAGAYEVTASDHWIPGISGDLIGLKRQNELARQLFATVTAGGSGYTSAPSVTVSDGSTAIAVLTSGAVTAVLFTHVKPGSGAVPTITFSGGGGSGAAATCTRADLPTLTDNSIVLPASTNPGQALVTPFPDSATETICVVWRKPAVGAQEIVGTLGPAPNTSAYGSALWYSSGSSKYFARAAGTDTTAQDLGSPGNPGDWLFFGVSYRPTVGRVVLGSGGVSGASALTKTPGVGEVSIGNSQLALFTTAAAEIAEFIHFPYGMNAAQLAVIYARSKARLAKLASPVSVL